MARKRTKKTLVDVVIPVHGRFDILKDCLEALPEAFGDISHSVYIVDNGSPDKEEARGFYSLLSNVSITKNQHNTGFPKACNQGAKKGNSPLVFFLNSDVILEPGSMDFLLRAMDDPKQGMVGMKLLFPSDEQLETASINKRIRPSQKVQHVGLATDIRANVKHIFLGWDADHKKVNAVKDVFALTGAALMVRREHFNRVGGFGLEYGLGTFEDVDLCMKIRELGYNISVITEAVGTHYTGATAEKYGAYFPLGKNQQIFLEKWMQKLPYTEWRHV